MMISNEKCLKIVELLKIYMFDINHALSTKNILSIFNENIPRLKCDVLSTVFEPNISFLLLTVVIEKQPRKLFP